LSTTITTTTKPTTYVGTLKLKGVATLPPSKNILQSPDTFTPSSNPLNLKTDPLFKTLGLTPSLAKEADIPGIMNVIQQGTQEMVSDAFEQMQLALKQKTPQEQIAFVKKMGPPPLGMSEQDYLHTLQSMSPKTVSSLMNNKANVSPEMEQAIGKEAIKSATPVLKERFINNPQGAYLVLKNTEGKIVATAAFHQFTDNHINPRNSLKGLDPKHALETTVYLLPEYKNKDSKDVALALRKTLNQLAQQKGYTHIWSQGDRSLQASSKELGYQELTPGTKFPDSPAFTPKKIEQLLQNNFGDYRLAWLKIKP
jgi:hypothetical protein